jgi:hypothetical protein
MIWSDADGMEDNSRRLSEEGEDSAKKAKDTFSVCNDSVGCRCSLARGNPEVIRKSENEHIFHPTFDNISVDLGLKLQMIPQIANHELDM